MQSSSYPFIPPSSTCMSDDLLFFDTFSHSNSDKENFDLVQFPSPVIIDLIKIVPLGQPIEANIPGNVRLGATNPSKCELEFFINDLTKQDAHTMTDLGRFLCSDKETEFTPPLQIQTDGLLLRGSYRTLTLAIFGQLVVFDEKTEDEQAIMSAASPPAQTPASPVASERDMPSIVRSLDEELIRRAQDEEASLQESITRSNEFTQDIPAFEGANHVTDDSILYELPVDNSLRKRTDVEELSNTGDATAVAGFNDTRDKKTEELEQQIGNDLEVSPRYSNKHTDVSSRRSTDKYGSTEDDRQLKQEQQQQQQTDDISADLDPQEWFFDVETYTLRALTCFPDPSLTLQERTLQASIALSDRQSFSENVEKEVRKVREMFEVLGCSNETKTEDWVTLVEDLTNDIANMSLSRTVSSDDMLEFLVEQVVCGLDMESAIRQKQTGFKVRHLKAGLKLATILFHSGGPAVGAMLKAGVIQKVLLIYNREQMSLPLRLLIFRCLSAACDTVEGVKHMIGCKYQFNDERQITEHMKKHLNESNNVELDACLEAILSMEELLTGYQYTVLLLVSNPATRVKTAIGNLIKKIRLFEDLSQLNALADVTRHDLNDNDDNVFEKDINDNVGKEEQEIRLETSLHLVQDVVCLIGEGCSNITQPIRHLPAKVQFHIKPSPSDSYLALFKWFKHFKTIECLDALLTFSRSGSIDLKKTTKLRSACLALIKLILDSPRGTQFFLSSDCYKQTASLVRNLSVKTELPVVSKNPHQLAKFPPPNDSDSHDDREDETLSIAACRDMSLRMIYCFKVLSCIDKLFDFHREISAIRSSSDNSKTICDPEKVLHQLFIISDHPYGLAAIMKHFSCIGNLDCILRFLDMPESQKHLEFVRETAIDYVLELVGTFCRLNNKVLEIAEEYLDTLIDLCKIKDKTLSNRIKSLLPWLTPFDVDEPLPLITYSDETFKKLTRVIRKSIPDCSIPFAEGLNYQLPPQLITAIRILRQLCISPQVESFIESNLDLLSSMRLLQADQVTSTLPAAICDTPQKNKSKRPIGHRIQNLIDSVNDSPVESLNQLNNLTKLYQPYDECICGDLKYHYAIMQLCEQEGLRRLLNTLRELIGNYPRPIYQSAALCGLRGRIVISYIHSVLMLLHTITCHLIDAREKEFRDTSVIGVVLETYSLLSFVPKPNNGKIEESRSRKADGLSILQESVTLRYDNYKLAQQSKKLILSILTSYTQICLSVSDSEANVISKSMWTKMLKELVDFTLSAPVFFHHGLDVITRILPPPLPLTSAATAAAATASVTAHEGPISRVGEEHSPSLKSINLRKLWSAHLHPLHQKIELMISNLSLCYPSSIRVQLYYLCNQLCDLSSNAACMVAKAVTDTLLTCAAKFNVQDSNSNHSHSTTMEQQSAVGDSQTQTQPSRQTEDTTAAGAAAGSIHTIITGTAGSKYAIKMAVNLAAHLIKNQDFETAFTNNLQVLSKKDQDKSLNYLYGIIKSQEDFKPSESGGAAAAAAPAIQQVETGTSAHNSSASLVINFIESIKLIAAVDSATVDLVSNLTPPEELTKINLIEMARKTSDRFDLTTGITRTYRLKVLMDLNSRAAHRSSEHASGASKRYDHRPTSSGHHHQELLVPPSHKSAYPPPAIRGRPRASTRPDSFRSRSQNTSRPPSIHVDDFNDMYGADAGGAQAASGRYAGGRKDDYRISPAARYQELAHGRVGSPMSAPMHGGGRHHYYNSQQPQHAPPPPPQSGGSHGGAGGRRSKYLKLK